MVPRPGGLEERRILGRDVEVPYFALGDLEVWGATAMALSERGYFIGQDAFSRADYEQAAAMFRQAVETDPESRDSYLRLAEALTYAGKAVDAIPVLQEFVAIAPQSAKGTEHSVKGPRGKEQGGGLRA